mmetsp:Transcript_28156/g.32813  ORF Transcript_28156/g.32813 Transcript_28156/m.32813 type:complete len:303 (-) Transcript_28156:241-1149(-)
MSPPTYQTESTDIVRNDQNNDVNVHVEEQSMFIVRHGDRWDYAHPEWKESAERIGDPPLSTLGHRQAREVGQYLDKIFVKETIQAEDVVLVSSPFLRCIQTSNELVSEFRHTKGDLAETMHIKPENCIFEFDLHNNGLHGSLPTLEERKNYFPRLDETHNKCSHTPSLPEDKDKFLQRCDDAITHLQRQYSSSKVLIVVTHAACCIGLVKAATGMELCDVNPAAPCSIYRLTRATATSYNDDDNDDNDDVWEIDHHSKDDGMNGFTGHLSELGECTIPWNHFNRNRWSEDYKDGYTGPTRKE